MNRPLLGTRIYLLYQVGHLGRHTLSKDERRNAYCEGGLGRASMPGFQAGCHRQKPHLQKGPYQ